MNRYVTFFLVFMLMLHVTAQKKEAYQLYNADGKKKSYRKLLKEAKKADVILFGELHNNAIAHWLQYELTSDLASKRKIILGFEMLERDNQEVVNDYLHEKINQKAMDTLARLWNNYSTDYKPLVDFAKDKKIEVCACNIPRRYANKVFKGGFEALNNLTKKEKKWIAPLPILYDADLPGYVAMTKMDHMMHMPEKMKQNMPKAQAIKDATMAYFILKYLKKNHLLIHYNGAYHSNNYEGIYWYLKKAKPDLKILTITTEEVASVQTFNKDFLNQADFIIQVDEHVTKTY